MNWIRTVAIGVIALICVVPAFSQAKASEARASGAFAEVLLRKTELLAEVESLSQGYTDANPKIIDLRYEVAALDRCLMRITAVQNADLPRLTLALGKLMVKRAALDSEFSRLSRNLNVDHPDYKRAKKRLEVYDAAIKEILP